MDKDIFLCYYIYKSNDICICVSLFVKERKSAIFVFLSVLQHKGLCPIIIGELYERFKASALLREPFD